MSSENTPIAEEENDDEFQRLLDDFIASELGDFEGLEENNDSSSETNDNPSESYSIPPVIEEDPAIKDLKDEEKNLYLAYLGLQDALNTITNEADIPPVKFSVTPEMLQPNYKPSIGKKIAEDTIACWDTLIKAKPNKVVNIKPDSTDEQLLDFAEAIDDNPLTLAIISYVETIIEIEGCEISYQEKCLKAERKRIEREIRQEHQRRQEKSRQYIDEITKQKFPIDADRLINNYFKTAQKDADGAYQILTANPAVFAPIEVNNIKPRFFGLIKATPQDGIRVNRLIGKFLKQLKI